MATRRLFLLGAGTLVLGACARVGESRLNPLNWFGRDSNEETIVAVTEDADPRPLVSQVTSLAVERTPTGAIIRATGLPPTQGWYAGALVPETDGPVGGVLAYRFRAVPPDSQTRVSTVQSRELTVGVSISAPVLAQTRVVQVIGARNVRSVRR